MKCVMKKGSGLEETAGRESMIKIAEFCHGKLEVIIVSATKENIILSQIFKAWFSFVVTNCMLIFWEPDLILSKELSTQSCNLYYALDL